MLREGIRTLHWRQTGSGRLCTLNLSLVSAGFRQKDVGSFEAWDIWDLTYLAFFFGGCTVWVLITQQMWKALGPKKPIMCDFFCFCFFGYRAQILGEQMFSWRDSFFFSWESMSHVSWQVFGNSNKRDPSKTPTRKDELIWWRLCWRWFLNPWSFMISLANPWKILLKLALERSTNCR